MAKPMASDANYTKCQIANWTGSGKEHVPQMASLLAAPTGRAKWTCRLLLDNFANIPKVHPSKISSDSI